MEITPKTATKFKSVYSTPDSGEASPSGSSAEKLCCFQPRQKLSASLRERLKRSRRSFTSPLSVAKRLCVDEENDAQQVTAATKETVNSPPVIGLNVDLNRNVLRPSNDSCARPISDPRPDLTQERDQLRREVKDKTEILRRLKMVKMYRSKNDLAKLQTLIDKWRSCAQAALYELQSEVTQDGRKASLPELIDLFGLDEDILHFDRTEEDFIT